MSVFDSVKHLTGTRYHRAEHNRDILTDYIMRLAHERGVRLSSSIEAERINYFGAWVFVPTAGLSSNVWYLDLASLYPNSMRALNISPETLIGTEEDLEESEYSEDEVVWSYIDPRPVKWLDDGESWAHYTDGEYKMVYDPSQPKVRWKDDPQTEKCYFVHPDVETGLITEGIEELIDMKYQFEGSLYEAIKRVVNSVYGFASYGTQYNTSPVYDWRLGESTTLAGRRIIKFTANTAVEKLQERGYNDASVVIGDTDGCGISLPSADDYDDCIEDVIAVVEEINEEEYPEFMHETFGVDRDAHYMEVEAESFARQLFVPAEKPSQPDSDGSKKRYSQHMYLEDCKPEKADVSVGDYHFEIEDSIDYTGLEAVRSDTADATTELQKSVLETLLREQEDGRGEIFDTLQDAYEQSISGDVRPQWLARRKGMSKDPSEYGSASRRPQPAYRGAKYAQEQFDVEFFEGDKPQYYAVDGIDGHRSTYRASTAEDGDVVDWVSLPQNKAVPDAITIDYETMTEKAVVDPLEPIIETMGWSWGDVKSGTTNGSLSVYM